MGSGQLSMYCIVCNIAAEKAKSQTLDHLNAILRAQHQTVTCDGTKQTD